MPRSTAGRLRVRYLGPATQDAVLRARSLRHAAASTTTISPGSALCSLRTRAPSWCCRRFPMRSTRAASPIFSSRNSSGSTTPALSTKALSPAARAQGDCLAQLACDVAEYWRSEPGPEPGLNVRRRLREGFLEVFTRGRRVRGFARRREPSARCSAAVWTPVPSSQLAKSILKAQRRRPLPTYSRRQHRDGPIARNRARFTPRSPCRRISPTLIHPDAAGQRLSRLIPISRNLRRRFHVPQSDLRSA